MSAADPLSLSLLAIAVMAAATYMMRIGGFWAMAYVPLTPRLRRMLEALPGSIVAATVLPIVANSGGAAVVALAAALAAMILVRNELLAVTTAVVVATLMRALGA